MSMLALKLHFQNTQKSYFFTKLEDAYTKKCETIWEYKVEIY